MFKRQINSKHVFKKNEDLIFKHIRNEIDPILGNNRHIIQTYNGANIINKTVGIVQTKIREIYKNGYFEMHTI